jgi:MFS family permease
VNTDASTGEHESFLIPNPTYMARVRAFMSAHSSSIISNLLLLVAESSRGLFLASMLNEFIFLTGGDKEAAKHYNTRAVTFFSTGRLVAAPLLGWLCDQFTFRDVYLFTILISLAGHGIYCFGTSPTAIIGARALVGLGSGVLSVCRTVIVVSTPPGEPRTHQLAILAICKFCGYALVPAISSYLVFDFFIGSLHITAFSSPAFLLFLLNIVMIPIVFFGIEPSLGKDPSGETQQSPPPPPLAPTDAPMLSIESGKDDLDDFDKSVATSGTLQEPLLEAESESQAVAAVSSSSASVSAASAPVISDPPGNPLLSPPVLIGMAVFFFVNLVSKGILTLLEASLTPFFQDLPKNANLDTDALIKVTSDFYFYIGLGGLPIFAFLGVKRSNYAWAPGDFNMLLSAFVVTAVGVIALAHPGVVDLNVTLIYLGAVSAWSYGSPISDVVGVSCFSSVVQGALRCQSKHAGPIFLRLVIDFTCNCACLQFSLTTGMPGQGKLIGFVTMAGSVGRIAFPTLLTWFSPGQVLIVSGCVAALCVPMLVGFRAWVRAIAAAALPGQKIPGAVF